jgi:paraquat-inducible protein B
MGKRANPAVIGAFVIGAVVLAVVAVAVIGSGRLFRKTYPAILYFDSDVNGLKVGAPVKFKGVEVGAVRDIMLNVSEMAALQRQPDAVRIPVIIEFDEEHIRAKGGRTRFEDPAYMKFLIDSGMRAQLRTESFVTGLLYVDLDIHPNAPVRLVNDPSVEYPEIPTLRTPLEQAQMRAAEFLAKLEKADIGGLVKSLRETVDGTNRLVNAPRLREAIDALPGAIQRVGAAAETLQGTLGSYRALAERVDGKVDPLLANVQDAAKEAAVALRTASDTLDGVRTMLHPNSTFGYEVNRTLNDLSAAARAVRRLAEDLNRNPTMLVRGKEAAKEQP